MQSVPSALSRAIAQLGDRAIIVVLVKSILLTLAAFLIAGALLGYGAYTAFAAQGWELSAEMGTLLAVIATIAGGWLLFRMVALAIIQFFADEIVIAVEQRHYPQALGAARSIGFAEEAMHSLRSLGRVLLVNGLAAIVALPLLVTAIGPALVFGVANSWLLGRELQDIVWIRHRPSPQSPPPLSALERLVLGALLTGLLAVPVANLLAPVIGIASAAHLVHGAMAKPG